VNERLRRAELTAGISEETLRSELTRLLEPDEDFRFGMLMDMLLGCLPLRTGRLRDQQRLRARHWMRWLMPSWEVCCVFPM
jgi:hypothetical protein